MFICAYCRVSSLGLFLLFLILHMVSSMNSICKDYQVTIAKRCRFTEKFLKEPYRQHTLLLFMFDLPSSEVAFSSFILFWTLRIKFFMATGSSCLSFIPEPVKWTTNHVLGDSLVCKLYKVCAKYAMQL